MSYLICYDICDDKRLVKVHRFLSRKCLQIQKSVFICLDNKLIQSLMLQASGMIKPNEDSLRCFQILNTELYQNNMITI